MDMINSSVLTYALLGGALGFVQDRAGQFMNHRRQQRKDAVAWKQREIDRLSAVEAVEARFLQLFELCKDHDVPEPAGIMRAAKAFDNVLGAYAEFTQDELLAHTAHAIAQQNLVVGMEALREGCHELVQQTSQLAVITEAKKDLEKNVQHVVTVLTARACS